jgi:energy-coupling factor transporter transmembrane protein EcfT
VHPLIRVVALLVFVSGLALARPVLLIAGGGVLLLLNLLTGYPAPGVLLQLVLRLRWLLLAILLVYGWWTPGDTLFPGIGSLSPTSAGLVVGLLRILSLVLIVAAVHVLMQVTSRSELLPAIMQLLRPVTTAAGRERLAVRILLSVETVSQVQALVCDTLKEHPLYNRKLSTLGKAAQTLYRAVLARAAQAEVGVIDVTVLESPPWWQWLIPLALCAVICISA